MKVTFLEASNKKPLSKQFKATEKIPYPHVKACLSHEFDISTLQELHDLIKQQGNLGRALLKGNLKEPLINQSRSKKTTKGEPTELLVLDIDGITLDSKITTPISSAQLQAWTESILIKLPSELFVTDYIVQGSASLGMKGNTISLHIFMLLDKPVVPSALKNWLRYQNFEIELFRSQISLSSNSHALSFPLDLCPADNSRIIFIAPPVFETPTDNPFVTDDDRIAIVSKTSKKVDLTPLINNVDVGALHNEKTLKLNELRELHNKPKRRAAKAITKVMNGEVYEVIDNPDQANITITDEDWPYIRCNLNGGDSAAYWFNAANPEFLLNFKDEPIWRIKDAAPDFYQEIQEKYEAKAKATNAKLIRPIVFRDEKTDTYWNGIYDPNANHFSKLYMSSRPGLTNFMQTHADSFDPEKDILEAIIDFNPQNDESTNLNLRPIYINNYLPSKYMTNNSPPATAIEYGQSNLISIQTPHIYKLLNHMLGNGQEELERFINWLAYIFQTKSKSMTAWVLTGVQGTGKGLFYTKILQPLFGPQYVPMRMLGNMEEKYNDYLQTALFMVVDEFRMRSASGSTTKIQDQLKNAITEPSVVIRNMRSNQVECESFTNYIFLTNREDAVQLDNGDRRYNIGVRQEVMIQDAHPEIVDNIDVLTREIGKFAGILSTYVYDKRLATTCINNQAKVEMRQRGMCDAEQFAESIKSGDIFEIAENILDLNIANMDFEKQEVSAAQKIIKKLLAKAVTEDHSAIAINDARTIYNVLVSPKDRLKQRAFGMKMSTFGLKSKQRRVKSSNSRDYTVNWDKNNFEKVGNLIDKFFNARDKEAFLTN